MDWKVYGREIVLKVKDESPAICPSCQRRTENRHERGKWRRIYHGFGFGRKVYLLARKERYFCSSYGKSALVPVYQTKFIDFSVRFLFNWLFVNSGGVMLFRLV